MLVKMAKNNAVKNPPPTFRARSQGTTVIRVMRSMLEKSSLLEASAGSGAFLMAGYYHRVSSTFVYWKFSLGV